MMEGLRGLLTGRPGLRRGKVVTDQLARVAEVLNASGVEYWADSGTLLGLVRDGELLPSDPDIDLAIWSEQEPGLAPVLRTFRQEGYRVRTERYRGFPFNHTCVPPLRSGLKRIDVYVYREAGEYAWAPAILPASATRSLRARRLTAPWRFLLHAMWARVVREVAVDAWPWRQFFESRTWWIPRDLLEHRTRLEGVPFQVPQRWEDYLEFRYGDWRVPATGWSFWTDDGAIRADPPGVVVSPAASDG